VSSLDRASPPASGPIRHFDFPEVDRRALANGLDFRVARISRLPVVSVKLFMRSGEGALGHDRAGLAVLTADAVDGGTKKRSGTDLAEAFERIGARFSVASGWEGTSAALSCLADRLPDALGLLAETVREPAFPPDEVDRAKEQHLAGIRQRSMDPASLASDVARTRYFAEAVPYARPLDGTMESIAAVTRDGLRGYADANYRPDKGGLIVVGDVDADEVEALAEEHFHSWSGAPGSTDGFTVAPAAEGRRVLIVTGRARCSPRSESATSGLRAPHQTIIRCRSPTWCSGARSRAAST